MGKTEVYSWRIDPELKSELEHEARLRHTSLAVLLERIARSWLSRDGDGPDGEDVQQKLHHGASRFIGTVHGRDPHRAEQARERIRKRLKRRGG